MSVKDFLHDLNLDELFATFEQEHISMDVLMDMSHEDLSSIGIAAFGHRHKILRKVKELAHNGGAEPAVPVGMSSAKHVGTQLIELPVTDKDYMAVSEEVSGFGGRERKRDSSSCICPQRYKQHMYCCVTLLPADAEHHL